MSFDQLPKIELHLHLEGAAPPDFIRRLADEKKIDLRAIFNPDGSYKFRDFNEFLRVYEAACSVLTGPEEFYRLTRAVLEQSQAHGAIYSEAFLSPDFCGGGDLAAWRDYLAAIEQAASESPVEMRAIVTCIRHEGPEQAKRAAACAMETAGSFLTGYGMGGDEMRGNAGDFSYSFDMAREAGLKITSHAGEWGGARSVRETLDDLTPLRIGHGVQAIEDPALVERLAQAGTVLEVCPGSNVALGVFPSWAEHPIEKLRNSGVKVTVSTDDPPFFHTDLSDEYRLLHETFGWEAAEFLEINRVAVEAAFCDDTTKETLIKALEAAYV